jgi:hypothetical protein
MQYSQQVESRIVVPGVLRADYYVEWPVAITGLQLVRSMCLGGNKLFA